MKNRSIKKLMIYAAAVISAFALSACTGDPADPGATSAPAPGKKDGLDGIVINEVVSVNSLSHIDADYGAADWLELKNTSSEEVDISGWKLADNPAAQRALEFPEGTKVPAGGFITVLCIPETAIPQSETRFIAPFGVSRTGENVYLSAPGSRSVSVSVPYLLSDISYARMEDGKYGFSNTPTFGAENSNIFATLEEATAEAPAADALRINELVNGSAGWAELKNISDEEIDQAMDIFEKVVKEVDAGV